jgi:spermidine/putrescine transport system ATP-binding protein
MAEVEGALVQLRTATRFAQNDRIHLLLRPEDFRLRPQAEFAPKEERSTLLLGQVLSTCYRGATYDVEVRLDNGKEILVTEFFDEDAETLAYNPGDPVAVSWFAGWEVVLPHGG